ncbi:AcrR family transcriptional regulator [Allocatelliglobosispora scoriae]|uniref:AcrR family transcriptional regulator n=1 Tax=Allocatelliglobosispora scoriae TaxID=643052 RepID=A0A841C375_9ACTN|nr:TetR/AcrR family transcriptional regulator [Allocatelliglobosispora scoriae]MBB5873400.1 AcrR family transcriptional regulator [Allocatelliglobosispora scoriae]
MTGADPKELLLGRVIDFLAASGITGKSLREIAIGAGTSHRMLIYHFGSREGLLAAVVAVIEAQQRSAMAAMAGESSRELMTALWRQVSDPAILPFVRLFFEIVGQAVQGVPGTERLLATLTEPWLAEGAATAERVGAAFDPAVIRMGVAVTRGLLLDLLAGADPAEVTASYQRFVALVAPES